MKRLITACLAFALANANAEPIHIPKAREITIDGNDADWLNAPRYKTGRLVGQNGPLPKPSDFGARMALAWDEEGLLVGVWVRDDHRLEYETEMYRGDSVELFLGTKVEHFQVVAGPGKTDLLPAVRTFLNDLRVKKSPELSVEVQSAAGLTGPATAEMPGYFIEARLPWQNLGVTPARSAEVSFQAYVNDLDLGKKRYRATLFPGEDGARKLRELQPLVLSEIASETPVNMRVHQLGDEVMIQALTEPSAKDRTLELRSKSEVLARVLLSGRDSQIGLTLPRSSLPESAEVFIDGKPSGTIRFHPGDLSRSDVEKLDYEVYPTVFSGAAFLPLELRFRKEIEQVRGGLNVTCRYFNSKFEEVLEAKTPGRYGAEITISAQDGHAIVRHVTLFRLPENVDWQKTVLRDLHFPAELGLDPAVESEHATDIADVFRRDWAANLGQKPYHATLLAGLFESKPLGKQGGYFESPRRRDSDWWFAFREKNGQIKSYDRLVTLPKGYESDPNKHWPLLVFLHGAGEGDTRESLNKWGPPKEIAKGREFPFIVAVPRSEPGQWQWWHPVQLAHFLDELEAEYRIDPDQIYMTGLSMGGSGTWRFATEYPERLAAIAPFCGNGIVDCAARLKELPIWIFQGEKDDPAIVLKTHEMVSALEKIGGKPKTSFSPNVGHNCWDEAYSATQLYEWLLSQRRKPGKNR